MELNTISFMLCDVRSHTYTSHIYIQIVAAFENHKISEETILKTSRISELYHLRDLKINFAIKDLILVEYLEIFLWKLN